MSRLFLHLKNFRSRRLSASEVTHKILFSCRFSCFSYPPKIFLPLKERKWTIWKPATWKPEHNPSFLSHTKGNLTTSFAAMSTPKLEAVPNVEIDFGRFKYILIKIYDKDAQGQEVSKSIVRGYNWAAYHADIYENVDAKLQEAGIESECVGGGRILHDVDKQSIQVYGYSTGYGKADHEITSEILKKHYPNYKNITWSNEGY